MFIMKRPISTSAVILTGLFGLAFCHETFKHSHHYVHRRVVGGLREELGQLTVIDPSLEEPTEIAKAVLYVGKDGEHVRTALEQVMFIPTPTNAVLSQALHAPPSTESSISDSNAASGPVERLDGQFVGNGTASSIDRVPWDGNRSFGVAYAPYSAGGNCKTTEQIEQDLSQLKYQYSLVRIYGTDCDQVSKVYPAAKNAGLKLFLGLFELQHVEDQVASIVSAVNGDWSIIDTVSVGNELVNNRQATSAEVLDSLRKTRSLLRSSGYTGPVVTVDTFVAVLEHPELCDESDYCAMNIHPFFDGNTSPGEAGPFITRMISEVKSKLANPSHRIVVTETGWPWQGTINKAATPGLSQQHLAIESIKSAFVDHPSDLILFSAFNDPWKPAAADTFFAEQYWGIDGLSSSF